MPNASMAVNLSSVHSRESGNQSFNSGSPLPRGRTVMCCSVRGNSNRPLLDEG